MSGKKPKATRKRMISCFAQIVQEHIPHQKSATTFLQQPTKDQGRDEHQGYRPSAFRSVGVIVPELTCLSR